MTRNARQSLTLHRRGGFTLVELLVAIGAVALIAVGIAAVFESVGRTVTGGRRVSLLNQTAAQLEQQMREDFRSMSRDGFLVIRNAYVDADANGSLTLTGDAVPLHPGDTVPRPRRADEIVFLAHGSFTSMRDSLHPERAARSSHARVYYGHLAKYDPASDAAWFARPEVRHGSVNGGFLPSNNSRFGYRGGVNEYASEWVLGRHVTLLVQPTGAEHGAPTPDPYQLMPPERWLDNDVQIAAQPAATSLLRRLAELGPATDPARVRTGSVNAFPVFASGLVDIATTDPAEIRTIVNDAAILPSVATLSHFDPAHASYIIDGDFARTPPASPMTGDRRFIHAWLRELLPAPSQAGSMGGHRVRGEPSMPDYVGTASQAGWQTIERAFRIADQRALTAHGFIARCTEFIVEFSFGETVDDPGSPRHGEIIWHGLERYVDADGNPNTSNGPFRDGREYRVAAPYPVDPATNNDRVHSTPYHRLNGVAASYPLADTTVYDRTLLSGGDPPIEQVAHFGYFDPTWEPTDQNDPPSIPWAWPRLIRVTLSLADAKDPSVERGYQFVFEVPERRSY
ncbi:MAG: type II secretion system protein [Phycisphaeraceae bacterium]|nr:type II secretion system protein [Phycisphaeraceae bacterium]